VRDNSIVLLPIRVMEQRGPHLPLSADSLVADYLARRISEQTGAIVAPAINYGHSPLLQAPSPTLPVRSSRER
jgi:creatinine amidohydrolase